MSHNGWYPRHRAVLSLLDSAIDDFLYLNANYRTGLAMASAEKIRALCPRGIDLRAIQRSLVRLEEVGRIKRYQSRGRRGNYPVLCCHYFVREPSGKWKRVSADSTIDWRKIQYEYVDDPSSLSYEFVMRTRTTLSSLADRGVTRLGTEVTPIKEEEQIPKSEIQDDKTATLNPESLNYEDDSMQSVNDENNSLENAFNGWDKPKDGLLHVGMSMMHSLHIDSNRIHESQMAVLDEANTAWKKSWKEIATGRLKLVDWVAMVVERSNQSKLSCPPVFYLRRGQLERGELQVRPAV
jgi:hypothetical protein